jgi:hypothetical protein
MAMQADDGMVGKPDCKMKGLLRSSIKIISFWAALCWG